MHRRPHDEHDGMKVWLAEAEVEQFLDAVEDTTHWIALGLAFRSGLRSAEVVEVTPTDVVDGTVRAVEGRPPAPQRTTHSDYSSNDTRLAEGSGEALRPRYWHLL